MGFQHSIKVAGKLRTAKCLHQLAVLLKEMQPNSGHGGDLLFMTRQQFDMAIRCKGVRRLLEQLDVDEVDQVDLFDALDADSNHRLEIDELINGVLKMGGKARKIDVVATRLLLKTVAEKVFRLGLLICDSRDDMGARFDKLADSVRRTAARLESQVRSSTIEVNARLDGLLPSAVGAVAETNTSQ